MRVVAFFVAKQCQYKQTAQSAKMPIEEANEILLKFKREEQKIEDRLKSRLYTSDGENDLQCFKQNTQHYLIPTEPEALERNENLMKELKAIKSNLRSKAIYSPVEMRWEEICKNYLESPTLPVTSWKCRLPVFV